MDEPVAGTDRAVEGTHSGLRLGAIFSTSKQIQGETRMRVRTCVDAESFLRNTQLELESHEAANSLMLGVCLQLARDPEGIKTPPCLKSVEDERGLVLAAMMTPPHKLVVYGHRGDLDAGARALAGDLVSGGWEVPGVLGPRGLRDGLPNGGPKPPGIGVNGCVISGCTSYGKSRRRCLSGGGCDWP
jgi:hypothetical protein